MREQNDVEIYKNGYIFIYNMDIMTIRASCENI